MTERKCVEFVEWDGWEENKVWETLLRCPKCKGFLPRDFPVSYQFKCKKCGSTLEALPTDDLDPEIEFMGKLCIVPDFAIKDK
jgi:uncharacterized protein (DUF983 family)